MLIRTSLILLFTSVGAVIILTLGGFFYAEHKIDKALSLSRQTDAIVHNVFELNRLASEINSAGIPRIQKQWAKKISSLYRTIAEYPGDLETTTRMQSETDLLGKTFNKLVEIFNKQKSSSTIISFRKALTYRFNSLTILLHSIAIMAENIEKKSYEQIQITQKKRNLFLLSCGVVWGAMILIWILTLWTGIMNPLHKLLQSISTVGKGNLGHRVPITSVKGTDDEMSNLIFSFNNMLDRLQELTVSRKRIIDSTEQERARIGRDLHDGISQMLASMKLHLEIISSNSTEKTGIHKVMEQMARAQEEIQRIVKDLRPVMLDDFGLLLTLQWFCDQESKTNFQLNVHIDEKDIPTRLHAPIFRIVQEASSNAQHHGKADTIQIQINQGENTIDLCVEDNGQGFDTGVKTKGNGLGNMWERVAAERGTFIIDSSKGSGCCIIASFPAHFT